MTSGEVTSKSASNDEAEVRRRAARRGWMGEAFERDVELSELGPPDDGYRTWPRVHFPIP